MAEDKNSLDDIPLESLSDDLLISNPISDPISDPVAEDLSWDMPSQLGDVDLEPTPQEKPAKAAKQVDGVAEGVLSKEAERQEIRDYLRIIAERDRAIEQMEEEQQFLEDQLEDANTEIDRLGQELDKLEVRAEEAERKLEQMEATPIADPSLYGTGAVENSGILDLRDQRLHPGKRSIGINLVTLWPMVRGLLVGLVLGAILLIGVLEISLYLSDKGELFQLVFGD